MKDYLSKEPHTRTFVDKSVSGYKDDNTEANREASGSIRVLPVSVVKIRVIMGRLCKESPDRVSIVENEEKKFGFLLKTKQSGIHFWITNEGARGCFLNASWNPTKVLTGQNVFYPKTEQEVEGIKFKMIPADLVELPFLVLVKVIDSLTGEKSWSCRSTILDAVRNGMVFYRELHITTYSGDFGSKENLQHCLRVLDAMGGMRRVIGVRSENPEDILELSMRSFANVKFDSYRNKSNFGVLETVAFTKCRSRNDDQKLFRVVMYDKLKEVSVSAKRERQKSGTSGQTGNEKVVSPEGVRMDLSRRMRIELQLMAGAFNELSSVLKIAKEGVEGSLEGINVIQSKFLRIAFPDESVFERKKAQLLVSCLKSLHFDWLVFPRAPTEILSRVRGTVPGVEEVFRTWKEQYDKPLLGKNRALKETDFDFQFTQSSLNSCYLALRSVGLDVTKISYLEASSLWANLATACLEKEEYQALTENEELIGFDREPLLTEKQRSSILKAAKKRALSSREVLKSCLSSSVISSNLLGNSVHD